MNGTFFIVLAAHFVLIRPLPSATSPPAGADFR
jgi:hypothetical protein